MVVVPIDERGRLTIPKEFAVRATRATVIPAGPFLILIPLPSKPLEASASWLETKGGRSELKALSEESARRDAVRRTKRRKHL